MLQERVFIFLVLTFAPVVLPLGTMQRYIAKGQLFCGDKPADNVLVKLIDYDSIGFDDVMGEVHTDADGNFQVEGKTEELSPIDPVLKLYHDCYDPLPCQRRWKMALPKQYILAVGEDPVNKTVDIGNINLEIVWYWERRSCIHSKRSIAD